MERRTCPGPWLRRSDGRGVAAHRGACRPHGCPRLAAVRARPSGVCVPCANGGRPRNARGRGDRRAAATCVRVPTGGSGPPGASAVRDHVRPRPTGRRSSFPRGRRNPWDARARRGGGTRHDSSRHRAGGDRGRLPLTRGGTRPTRDRVRRGRRADRARREGRASRDAVRSVAGVPPALRLARGRAAGALCAPAVSLLGDPAARGRLGRGQAARSRRPEGRSGGRGYSRAQGRAHSAAPRACQRRCDARRDRSHDHRGDATERPWDGCAAGRRALTIGSPGARRRRARPRRARGARRERLGDRPPRRARGARARDGTRSPARHTWGGRRDRPVTCAHEALRHRLRARARAGLASTPTTHRALPRRGNAQSARATPHGTPGAA